MLSVLLGVLSSVRRGCDGAQRFRRERCARSQIASEATVSSPRKSPTKRGYDAKWRRTRARYLRHHPTCEYPDGCKRAAEDVHHLDGKGPLGPAGHDWDNLQALCHSHHSQVTNAAMPKRKRPAPRHPGLIA